MVKKWFADFKHDRTNTNDAERSGRPNSAVVPENVTKSTSSHEKALYEMEVLLDQDLCQTQEELARKLGVTQRTI